MTMAATLSDMTATNRSLVEATQDAELATLIRRLAAKRPEILTAWTPPPAPRIAAPPATRSTTPPAPVPVPVSRRPYPLPIPRPLPALAPHPVTGDHPTREAFPVPRATVDSLARLRAIAAGTHRPDTYWPAHATDAYLAKKRRPTPLQQVTRTIRTIGRTAHRVHGLSTLATLTALVFLTGCLTAPLLPG